MNVSRLLWTALILIPLCICCSSSNDDDDDAFDAGDDREWQTATPEEVGLDADLLAQAGEEAMDERWNTQGIVVIKEGKLIAEWYAEGHDAGSWATSWSMGKSITSATIGLLYDEGLIESLALPMTTWIPEWEGTDKAEITLRDVLTMSSGLDWLESYGMDFESIRDSDVLRLVGEPDPVDLAIGQPLVVEPGTRWLYSSGDTMLLSRVISATAGRNATEFAGERIFEPLNMEPADWWVDSQGYTYTFCCMDTTSRSFARFGQLYLQQGVWGGEQIVSEEWVNLSVTELANSYAGYGLQWWLNRTDAIDHDPTLPDDLYMALGKDGQVIGVFPSQNMVVVRNGLYRKPEGPAVAPDGLFPAGLYSDGLGFTGSIPPGEGWTEMNFLRPFFQAVVQE